MRRDLAIKRYWDGRGREFGGESKATLGELHLRLLENRTLARIIRRLAPSSILDAGCGNGYSTKFLAAQYPDIRFVGMDYSDVLIRAARIRSGSNCTFVVADVTDPATYPDGLFDIVLTQRCLQNLPTYGDQSRAIANLLSKLASGGSLLLVECSKEGLAQMNRWRRRIGRSERTGVEPWHNTFLEDRRIAHDFGAAVVCFSSTYMILTRLVSQRLAPIAWRLPSIGSFGYARLYAIHERAGKK